MRQHILSLSIIKVHKQSQYRSREREREMVNLVLAYMKLLHKLMKLLCGLKSQTVEIEPGTVINFWVPKTPDHKNKPPVLLLHGFFLNGILTWQFTVFALTSKYSVYVPDLLFFGDSFSDKMERSPEFQAECLAKGLKKLGVEKCIVVGFSYGGFIGFKMAEMYPHLVESFIASGSVTALTESISADFLPRAGYSCWQDLLLPESVEALKVLLSFGFNKLPWIPNRVHKDYLESMCNNKKERTELLDALVVSDNSSKIHDYSQMIHLIWGENDQIIKMELAHDLKEQLGEKTMMHCIRKAGHLAALERPFVFNKQLKTSLASLIEAEQITKS